MANEHSDAKIDKLKVVNESSHFLKVRIAIADQVVVTILDDDPPNTPGAVVVEVADA